MSDVRVEMAKPDMGTTLLLGHPGVIAYLHRQEGIRTEKV